MKTYIGGTDPSGRPSVMVEEDGIRHQLVHHIRHSPDGFNWGYGGSGPAELARCILIDYFGDDAKCSECGATGTLTIPADHAEAEHTELCWECGGEKFKLPVNYQDFKFQVIAGLPSAGWTLTEEKIAEWVRAFLGEREG